MTDFPADVCSKIVYLQFSHLTVIFLKYTEGLIQGDINKSDTI